MGAGFIQTNNGGISVKNGGIVVAADADPCCCATTPCSQSISQAGWPSSYAISGYFDGLVVMSACTGDAPSANPPWDGVLPRSFVGTTTPYLFESPASINGKSLGLASVRLCDDESGYPIGCPIHQFMLSVMPGTGPQPGWVGFKDTGTDPSGTYVRVPNGSLNCGGCASGPSTLTLV